MSYIVLRTYYRAGGAASLPSSERLWLRLKPALRPGESNRKQDRAREGVAQTKRNFVCSGQQKRGPIVLSDDSRDDGESRKKDKRRKPGSEKKQRQAVGVWSYAAWTDGLAIGMMLRNGADRLKRLWNARKGGAGRRQKSTEKAFVPEGEGAAIHSSRE